MNTTDSPQTSTSPPIILDTSTNTSSSSPPTQPFTNVSNNSKSITPLPSTNNISNNNINNNNNGKKQVTITSPSTTNNTKAGQSQVNLGQPSESGKSGSTFSQSKITLRTCCGVVELTSMKLACLMGMLVTVIGLLVLAAVAIAAFVTATTKATDILIAVGKLTSTFESSNALVMKHVYSGYGSEQLNEAVYFEWKNKTADMKSTINSILKTLDDKTLQSIFNSTVITASNSMVNINNQALLYLKTQPQDSIDKINSVEFNTQKDIFKSGLDQLVNYIQEEEKAKDAQVLGITLVQLIVIVISLVVILPLIVFVFTYAINRDSLYMEKIRRANAIMLMDTMEDDGLRALFKIHCEKEKSTENYLLLEKIQYYRSLCERSIDLQMRLYGGQDNNNILSDISSDISTAESSPSAAKKKKESPLEKEYAEIEGKKYEVAFEIFTEFLEVTGDMAVNISHVLVDAVKDKLDKFNDKQIETLPEDMFNILEKETCLVMMDTHHRFKQSLAFQREMKIDKIKVDKLKKKKENEF